MMNVTLTIIRRVEEREDRTSLSYSTQVDLPVIPRRDETVQLQHKNGATYFHVMDVIYYPISQSTAGKISVTNPNTMPVQVVLDGTSGHIDDTEIAAIVSDNNKMSIGKWTKGTLGYTVEWKPKKKN